MTLQEIFDLGIQMAIDADPRGRKTVEKQLKKAKEDYKKLSEKEKKFFDMESLKHPYADSRIYIDSKKEIKTIIAGIDADSGEMVLIDRLNEKGKKIDAAIIHHPYSSGLAGLHEVMSMLAESAADEGVPVNVAHALIQDRMKYIYKRFAGVPNHNQTVDTAQLLGIPLISLHTVWDNLGWKFMTNFVAKKTYDTVGELLEDILEIPEFAEARKYKAHPFITAGSRSSKAGKIHVDFTGGTNAGKEMIAEYAKIGVGTIIQMHISEDEVKEMQKYHINAIDTGHIPSDSIGANLFLDALEKKGIGVISFGGLLRVKR